VHREASDGLGPNHHLVEQTQFLLSDRSAHRHLERSVYSVSSVIDGLSRRDLCSANNAQRARHLLLDGTLWCGGELEESADNIGGENLTGATLDLLHCAPR